jgi:subtilase family serine protease
VRRFLMVAMAAIAAATLAACSHSSLQQSLLPSQPNAAYPSAFSAPGVMTQEELLVMGSQRYRACGAAVPGYETCYAILSNATISPDLSPRSCLHLPGCYMPVDLQGAYGITSAAKTKGKGVTLAVVDAYGYTGGYKGAAKDLATYRKFAGLPACGKTCFTILNENGGTKLPKPGTGGNAGWQGEEALDIDMVSAICPKCHILMIQANSASSNDLLKGEATALKKAKYVSNSWGSVEQAPAYPLFDSHAGAIITASAGDDGAGVPLNQYGPSPESQPCGFTGVVCVGGTSLLVSGGSYVSEKVWEDFHYKYKGKIYNLGATGSGCSAMVAKPSWQTDKGCKMRSATDISANADPITGVVITCSPCNGGASSGLQGGVGGTSASAPMIAAMYALAGGASLGNAAAQKIWSSSAGNFHDVTSGFNDSAKMKPPLSSGDKKTGLICGSAIAYICKAGAGYDGPTGMGSPNGLGAF